VFHSTCLYLVPIARAHFACPNLITCPQSEWSEFGSTLVTHFFCKCHPRITRTRKYLSSVPDILQLHQSVGNWCLQLSLFCGTRVNWWSFITCHIPLLCDIKTCAGLLRVIFSCRNLEVWDAAWLSNFTLLECTFQQHNSPAGSFPLLECTFQHMSCTSLETNTAWLALVAQTNMAQNKIGYLGWRKFTIPVAIALSGKACATLCVEMQLGGCYVNWSHLTCLLGTKNC
jgi:hypothetical protein